MLTHPLDDFVQALLRMDRPAAAHVFGGGAGSTPRARLEALVIPALEQLGRGWETGHIALAQVYMAGRICEDLAESVLPAAAQGRAAGPTLAVAVVEDSHALGKKLVLSVPRSAGYSVLDYGTGVGAKTAAERALGDKVDVLLLSSLMLRSALRIEETTSRLREGASPPKVVVGGAPFRFDSQLWKHVGADAMGHSAGDAVSIVETLVGLKGCDRP